MICLFTNCSRVIYSHEEVMNGYKFKQDLINHFGLPTYKREDSGITEWIYDFGSGVIGGSASRTINGTDYTALRLNNFSRYVKFTLNADDRVIKWQTQGVNFEEREKQPGKTWALIIAGLAACIALGAYIGNDGY